MSDSLAPDEIAAELIDIDAAKSRHANAARLIRSGRPGAASYVRSSLVAAVASLLLASPALAQVEEPITATPPLQLTTPLGISSNGSVGPAGIPLDSTEITSPGVSPAPTGGVTGTIAIPANGAITSGGTTCSTVGASPAGMYGSASTYDGGGTAPGTSTPASSATTGSMATSVGAGMLATSTSPGMSPMTITPATAGLSTITGMLDTSGTSGMCGSGSTSMAASSTPTSTSPTTPGGVARTGIPLGAMEISNLGVGSAPAVPLPSVLPVTGGGAAAAAGTGSGGFVGAGSAGVNGNSIPARALRTFILCQRS
jgi:hypothetical protein